MAFQAFTLSRIFEKPPDSKDKFNIQCLESCLPNIYIGTKQGAVHHLVLNSPTDPNSNQSYTREATARKLSSSPVLRIRLVPVFNHLLALSNRSITVHNMFSLEANPSFKKIPNVSLFEIWRTEDRVQMITCPGQKKLIRVHVLGVDGWSVLKEIGLVQEPVELAVEAGCVCVGTGDRYLLCDLESGQKEALFQHGHAKRQVLVGSAGAGEFLVNGPGGLSLRVCLLQELQRSITRLAAFHHFFKGNFTDARDLFIKGDLDPRELLHLYPALRASLRAALPADFRPQTEHGAKARRLRELWDSEAGSELLYLGFLRDFLGAVRWRESAEVDCALLWLSVRMADSDGLLQLVSEPNVCHLETCEEILLKGGRFFALGFLYQSHGKHQDAIKTWVDLVDGVRSDRSCCDVLELIVSTLTELEDRDVVWTHANWTLRNSQELGVQIFTKRSADDQFPSEDVLALLETYPKARTLYLEFLINESNSEEAGHHTLLALAYVSQCLQNQEDEQTRGKLQQLLWDSHRYDVSAVYEQLKPTPLHLEKAIVLGRSGDQCGALTLLVRDSPQPSLAEEYCLRLTDKDSQSTQELLLSLLNIYLSSEEHSAAALDLLNKYSGLLSGEKVLDVLPERWSVGLVSKYLVGSVRETFHQSRMRKVQQALEQARMLRHKALWLQTTASMLRLDGRQSCVVCQKVLTEPQFARAPDGALLHLDCANRSCAVPGSVK